MLYIFIFILGIAVGSFLGVLIDRLPQEESIMGRSHCDYCKKNLEWVDLVPVFSFLALGAKCRRCKGKLSMFYPLVELTTGIAIVLVTMFAVKNMTGSPVSVILRGGTLTDSLLLIHNNFLYLIALIGITACSIVIFYADFKYQLIPDSIQVALFGFSFLYLITRGVTPQIFAEHILGAFITMLPILLLFVVTKGKGMGFGDVKLAFSMGFLLGITGGLNAVYLGFISGAVIGILLILFKKKNIKSKIAFGPFLIMGLLITLFLNLNIVQILRTIYTF